MLELKAYHWFFLTAALILVIGTFHYFISNDTVTDINIHDTYYVIPVIYFTLAFALIYAVAASMYWLLRNFRLVRALTLFHTVISIGALVLFWTLIPILRATDDLFVQRAETAEWILYFAAIFAQLLFIINITIGLTKGRKQ